MTYRKEKKIDRSQKAEQKNNKQENPKKQENLIINSEIPNHYSLHCPNSKNGEAKIQPNRAQEEIP